VPSHAVSDPPPVGPRSPEYDAVQKRLARGWNTWDVHSVTTQVLLPEGLAIHVGMKHNSTLNGDAFLANALIGRLEPGAEIVTPGPHAWDGSYTELTVEWKSHRWRVQSGHAGSDLVLLVSPLDSNGVGLPATVVFSVDYLWNRPGTVSHNSDAIEARDSSATVAIYCTCDRAESETSVAVPPGGAHFVADLTGSVGVSTGTRRSIAQIEATLDKQRSEFSLSLEPEAKRKPILDVIETTMGWDTIYEPEKERVVTPVSRVWSEGWGGYVLFGGDTFFAAGLAGSGDPDLAYANSIEMLREATPAGFVPNYARAGGWKSFDRSEAPVGAIVVLDLYEKYHERWFVEDAFTPLLKWNRWWAEHRDLDGYLTWGSDGENRPESVDDRWRGTWQAALWESDLDNSPMYDGATYNPQTHLLEYADVGLMSLYVADCNALAQMAALLGKTTEAKELGERGARYRAKLETLWDADAGIFLNRNLHTGEKSLRLSPTNFYPLLAKVATGAQAHTMIEKHLMNPREFWGEWVIPSIARNDPAFGDQNYWRGRIWGPMNYLVYLGLRNYPAEKVRRGLLAERSYALFAKEWMEKRHVHENYNAITGTGDDVSNSDRFYHWGALLGYVEYLEQAAP
jgi:putative isomerase